MADKKNLLDNFRKLDKSYLLDPDAVIEKIENVAHSSDADNDDVHMVDIDLLIPFKNHPFVINTEDAKFKELVDSIDEYGILQPIIIRQCGMRYEIISGHCRTEAAKILGLKQLPAKCVELDDAMATIIMVHSNVYARDKISISEKVRAYRMCFDAEAAAGKSRSQTAGLIGAGKDSKRQVYRFVRLSYLIDELLNILDNGKITIDTGVEFAYLSEDNQKILYSVIDEYGIYPSVAQAKIVREKIKGMEESEVPEVSRETFISLLVDIPKPKIQNKVSFKTKDIQGYFDDNTTADQMTIVIKKLLEKYKAGEIDIDDI